MALKTCHECGSKVSSQAKLCPRCGAPVRPSSFAQSVKALMQFAFLIGCVWFLAQVFGGDAVSENKRGSRAAVNGRATTDAKGAASSSRAPTKHREGDQVNPGYISCVVRESWWSKHSSGNPVLNQAPDAMFLFVRLAVRNNDKKARLLVPFKLVDDKGSEYEASSKGWTVEGSIGVLTSLNPDVTKEGTVIFDVPPSRNYRLKVPGGYWSSEDSFIELSPRPGWGGG